MSRFANGNILSTPSSFIRQCKMNIQNFCLFVIFVSAVMLGVIKIGFNTSIWCCILTHIFSWLNTEKLPALILLNPQVYHASEGVIMNHRVHYFHDSSLSYFYRIKAMSWITAGHLQWIIICKNQKAYFYVHKKLAQNFLGFLIPH